MIRSGKGKRLPVNVFVSFDHDDNAAVDGFKALSSNPNHPIVFHDRSLCEVVKSRRGKPIIYLPLDPRSKPVRAAIMSKFRQASRLVVLIGSRTHKSEWVVWEVTAFLSFKKSVTKKTASNRVCGMTLKGCGNSEIPKCLSKHSVGVFQWSPRRLFEWMNQAV